MKPGSEEIVLVGKSKEPVRIAQLETGDAWYVSRRYNLADYKKTQYLHGDGAWRPMTYVGNRPTGLYQTKDECKSAIQRFERIERGEIPAPPEPAPQRGGQTAMQRLSQLLEETTGKALKYHPTDDY